MKSVGEVMSIGRTFKEALQKVHVFIGNNSNGFDEIKFNTVDKNIIKETIINNLKVPNDKRIFYIGEALRNNFTVEDINRYTNIDKWFYFNKRDYRLWE